MRIHALTFFVLATTAHAQSQPPAHVGDFLRVQFTDSTHVKGPLTKLTSEMLFIRGCRLCRSEGYELYRVSQVERRELGPTHKAVGFLLGTAAGAVTGALTNGSFAGPGPDTHGKLWPFLALAGGIAGTFVGQIWRSEHWVPVRLR